MPESLFLKAFRRAWLLPAIGLALAGSVALGQQPPPAPVRVATVVERDVAGGHAFVGTVMPLRGSSIGSAVDGRVVDFPVNQGDRVSKGQVLAQLLTGQLDIQLAGAKAELELRKAELAELENGSRPEEIEQAQARYLAQKAAMEYAEGRLGRAQKLYEGAKITYDELQQATSLADQARQNYAEARAGWELAVQGPRKEAIAQARARVAVQEEAVKAIEDQLVKHTVRSPFDGYVVEEHTEVGQWVAKAGLVARVVELDEVEVEVMVLENYVPALKVGTEARVEIPALPREVFQGHVSAIVPQADPRSRSFPVRVRLKNQIDEDGPLVQAGMFARVTLPVGRKEQARLVPKDALVLGGPSPVVYVVEPDAKDRQKLVVRPVPVQLGIAEGKLIEVKGELRGGEKVVVQGNERLRPMAEVTILQEVEAR